MTPDRLTPDVLARLIAALQAITWDGDEPSKYLTLKVGDGPRADVTGFVAYDDVIDLEWKVFQTEE